MALTREQLIARRSFLGSSDIAAVAKLSRFKGPHHVWMQKVPSTETCPMCRGTGVSPTGDDDVTPCATCEGVGTLTFDTVDDETSEAAEIGDVVEEPLARLYARRSGRALRKVTGSAIHPQHEWIAAMPDFESDDGGPDVEVKMVGAHMIDEWGEYDDEIPADYYAQVTWQMMCRGKRSTHVVANLGGTRLRVYDVPFNERLAGELLEVGREFWFCHVVPRIPPPIDGTKSARAFLDRRFPQALKGIVRAPIEALGIVHELREVRETIKQGAKRKEELETLLRALIGDAEGIADPSWGTATWRLTESNGVEWKAIAEAMRLHYEQARAKANADALWSTLVALHTRPGYRRLHVSKPTHETKGKPRR